MTMAHYERMKDFRYPRNQREAGIEHLLWERRAGPIRPFWVFPAVAVFCAVAWFALIQIVMMVLR